MPPMFAAKNKLVICLFMFLFFAFSSSLLIAAELDDFVITIKSDNPSSSPDTEFTIPTDNTLTYNYNIECNNDGINDNNTAVTGDFTCTYPVAGTYTIRIKDNSAANIGFPRILFNDQGDRRKIISIDQWGSNKWASMEDAFSGTSNMLVNAADKPDLLFVSNLSSMFQNALLANPNTSGWNTINITDMSFMFFNAVSANPDTRLWDISKVTDMSFMFIGVTIPTFDYDTLLKSFSEQIVENNVSFHGGNSKYCAIGYHNNLSNAAGNNWSINDGGLDPECLTSFAFISTWKTDNQGPSNDSSITIPSFGSGYQYQVDWNNDGDLLDANEATIYSTTTTHDFTVPGTYTIRIVGMFPHIYFNNEFDVKKIISVNQWGYNKWNSMANAFFGASNLTVSATDIPDFSRLSSLKFMFYQASIANPDTSNWNLSTVTSLRWMFYEALSATPNTLNWDVSSVINMDFLFRNTVSANPDTSNWDTGSVLSMRGMFEETVVANPDTSNWDTSKVQNMSDMFRGALIATANTSLWVTSDVRNMSGMFAGTLAIPNPANPDTSNWNTSEVTDMSEMFAFATVANPNTANWNTAKVTTMRSMFNNASQATPNTTNWITNEVTDMAGMFNKAALASPVTSTWNTSKVTNMAAMFWGAASATPNTTNWNTALVTDMSRMFADATAANPDTQLWNTANVETMKSMFSKASIATPNTSNWNTTKVTDMSFMFFEALLANPDTNSWDVSSLTTMEAMFFRAPLANPNTSTWITGNVTNMRLMFTDAFSATPNTSNWNVSSVTMMESMFAGASLANPDTSTWSTSNLINMSSMFSGALSANPDVSNWDVANVESMNAVFNFTAVANPDTSNWNTSSVNDMSGMFSFAELANPDVSQWDTSQVTDMSNMFREADLANPDTSNWNTSQVTTMYSMFYRAFSVNPDLSSWDVSNVAIMTNMFLEVNLPRNDYEAILIGFNQQNLQFNVFFDGGTSNYCSNAAENARLNMTNADSWNILDGGRDCTPINAPDLSNDDDSGNLSTDNITSVTSPDFTISCTDIGNTVTLYTDKPTSNTVIATQLCSAAGSTTVSASVLNEGAHQITYKETANNMASNHSPFLNVIIDTLAPSAPQINPVSNTLINISGIAEPASQVTLTGATCTNSPVIVTSGGNWDCQLATFLAAGLEISAVAIDVAGNQSNTSSTNVIAANSAPSFSVFCDIDATDVTGNGINDYQFPNFIYNISTGPASESGQSYSLTQTTVSDPDVVVQNLQLMQNGDISISINPSSNGVAVFQIIMQDDGGTALGGIDTTSTEFYVYHFADLSLDPDLPMDIIYKNTMDACRNVIRNP